MELDASLWGYILQLHEFIGRLRGETLTTGLDVGHSGIKLVTVEHKRNGKCTVLAAGMEPLPEGAVVDNEIRDQRAVQDALSKLLDRTSMGSVRGDLVVSVNWTAGVLCDRIGVRVDKGRNEDEAILQTAMSRSPFDDTDNVLDYEILSRQDGSVDALVVAAKNNMLNSWASFFSNAGFHPVAIDIDAFSLCNVYYHNASETDGSIAIFNMGEKKSHISFIRDGVFHAARAVQSGTVGGAIQLISRQLGVDSATCIAILQGKKKDFDQSLLDTSMEYVCEEMSMGVEIALRYFSASDSTGSPVKVWLTGGGATLPGLAKLMSDRLSIDVQLMQPFANVDYDPEVIEGVGSHDSLLNLYAPALGLALRRF